VSSLTDPLPSKLATELAGVRAALDATIPSKRLDDNLLIATWNLRAFGDLTENWNATEDDSPKRDLRALAVITEIVSRFDVIALQEVRGNIKCLRHMLKALGPHWAFLLTDITRGSAGNDERMAFLFDTRRVKSSGLACELVVPPEWLDEIGDDALREQFARTPYAASFVTGHQTFILVTLHVLWGKSSADRIPELTGIARWMASWAEQEAEWRHNLFVLGDFNIDRKDDDAYKAFTSTGLTVPDSLDAVPRTIFGGGDANKHYDQIAWFESGSRHLLTMDHLGAGGFDFLECALTEMTPQEISWRISDHYPLWAEFSTRTP
jgi:endonuclease/exonuclease/phosphatase family metal-dependent hydrolase